MAADEPNTTEQMAGEGVARRPVAGLVGVVVAAVGIGAVVVSAFMRWYAFAALPSFQRDPGGRSARVLLWLLLVALAAMVAYHGSGTDRGRSPGGRLALLVSAAGLAALVGWQLNWFSPAWPVRVGGLVAACGVLAVLTGSVLTVMPHRRCVRPSRTQTRSSSRTRWRALAGMVAALVMLATAGAAGGVAAGRQVVDRTTTAALPSVPVAAPADLHRVRWQVSLGEDRRVLTTSGRYLLLGRRDGVEVLDATTGRQRWHYYRRYDTYQLASALLAPNTSTVVAVYRNPTGPRTASTVVIGLDLATGRTRWQWTRPVDPGNSDPLIDGSSDWQVTGAELIYISGFVGDVNVTAYGLRTGAVIWNHHLGAPPDTRQPECSPPRTGVAVVRGVLALILECDTRTQAVRRIQAYSATTGAKLWNRTTPLRALAYLQSTTYGGDMAVSMSSPDATELLDATTGRIVRTIGPPPAAIFDTAPTLTLSAENPATLTAIDSHTGRTRWNHRLPGINASKVAPLLAAYPTTAYLIATDPASSAFITPISVATGHPTAALKFPGHDTPDKTLAGPGVLIVQTTPPVGQTGSDNDTLYGLG